jgi:hypothetical protein
MGLASQPSYVTNIIQSIGNPVLQFEILPGLLVAQVFSFPIYSVEFFFFVFYTVVTGFFAYLFVYRYLKIVFDDNRTKLVIFSLFGGLIYLFFPYNIMGDNFPELFLFRALLPLYLLLFLEFTVKRKAILLASSSIILAYMTMMDPRAILFGPLIVFFFIVLPIFCLSSGVKPRIAIFSSFILSLLVSIFISAFSITPRLALDGVSTSVPVPFVKEAFRYTYADIVNSLSGLSFEGTYHSIVSILPHNIFHIFTAIELLIPIVVFSTLFMVPVKKFGKKLAIYVFIPMLFTLFLLSFFGDIGGQPLFEKLLFSVPPESLLSSVKTVSLLFRTPRFTNIDLALFYSLFSPLAMALSYKFLIIETKQVFTLKNLSPLIKEKIGKKFAKKRKIIFGLLIAFYLVSILTNVFIFSAKGDIFSNFTGERAKAYDQVYKIFGNDAGFSGLISVPYSDIIWGFSQPSVGMGESVLRYIYAYALEPSSPTSLLSRNQTGELANILNIAGIKYIILDNYLRDTQNIASNLNHSLSFTFCTTIGELYVYKISCFTDVSLVNPILVNGGIETYFKILNGLNSLNINTSFAPIFMDGPITWNNIQNFGPILSSPNKSILDLLAPFLLNDTQSIIISPAQYTNHYDPNNFWSPSYVSDTHQGVWTTNWYAQTNYAWEYSYQPDYGFAFTSAHDKLAINFEISKSCNYHIFVRTLMYPGNGSLGVGIDNSQIILNTGWTINSTEFIWHDLGQFDLFKGFHTLNLVNKIGLNAINLVLVVPSGEVQLLETFVDDFYKVVGDIKLLTPSVQNQSDIHRVDYNFNVYEDGQYSMIIQVNSDGSINKSDPNEIKLLVDNMMYETSIVSSDPLVVSIHGLNLSQGEKSIEVLSSKHLLNGSSVTIYGPQNSYADTLLSHNTQPANVSVVSMSTNHVRPTYSESTISFNANSSFMFILPEVFTGTTRVSFDSLSFNISYCTIPVYNVYTGILLELPNGTWQSFTVMVYNDMERSSIKSDQAALLNMATVLVFAIAVDVLFIFKYDKITHMAHRIIKKQ